MRPSARRVRASLGAGVGFSPAKTSGFSTMTRSGRVRVEAPDFGARASARSSNITHIRRADCMGEHPVTVEVRALEGLGLEELRDEWRRRYGEPPKLRSSEFLARLLAWRIQAEAFGGLDAGLRKALLSKRTPPTGPELHPGMQLAREWRGREERVDVLEDGFRWRGETYKSLSKVASAMTGTKWNGPRFFGLREAA